MGLCWLWGRVPKRHESLFWRNANEDEFGKCITRLELGEAFLCPRKIRPPLIILQGHVSPGPDVVSYNTIMTDCGGSGQAGGQVDSFFSL